MDVFNRRVLLAAGLAVPFVALLPSSALSQTLSPSEAAPVEPSSPPGIPESPALTGALLKDDVSVVRSFASWGIEAWGFAEMEGYAQTLEGVLTLKTGAVPSYLTEYRRAVSLMRDARNRLGTDASAFIHLMFTERGGAATPLTAIGRARQFVFDEIVRHIVASGGFKKFGLVNYDGFINVSFYDSRSYRRG
jgi:hypothetical protein